MHKFFSFGLVLLSISTFLACSNEESGENSLNLPNSSGVPNELLVVMDSVKWKGELGEVVREAFGAPLEGLPQEEPNLQLRYISPRYFKGFLKLYPNILFVTTLDDDSPDSRRLQSYFTKESREEILNNENRYYQALENEYARNQDVLHIFAPTEERLIQRLEESGSSLQNFFVEKERERMQANYRRTGQRKLAKHLQQQHDFSMIIPKGYEIAIEKENFAWIRLLDNVDRNIWFTYMPFTDEAVFDKENLIALRNAEGKKYIWGSDSTTYLKTEQDVEIISREVNFNGRYAVEMRGLWRLNEMVMGGPFLSYAFVDEAQNRLYYIEGFVYAPGEKKREAMREIEAILWSFRTPQAGAENEASVADNR